MAAVLLLCTLAPAQEEQQRSRRVWPEDHGVSLAALVVVERAGALAGGDSVGSGAPGLVALGGSVDTHEAGLWRGGTFTVTVQATSGRRPSSFIGDFQGTSNIEAREEIRVHEAWYGHEFRNARGQLLFGVQDLNASFNFLQNGAPFVNSSFGITPEFAQIGPPVFPRTGLGIHARYRFARHGYVLAGAYNAVAADRFAEQFRVRRKDGLLLSAEAGVLHPKTGLKAGVGSWYSDRRFIDLASTPRNNDSGVYVIAERPFRARHGAQVSPFLQLGWARSDRNQIGTYHGARVQFAGWFRGRPDDRFGLAIADAVNGDRFLEANPGRVRRETVIEATYLASLARWVSIQPDLQLVVNPGMDAEASNAWVATLRLIFQPFALMR